MKKYAYHKITGDRGWVVAPNGNFAAIVAEFPVNAAQDIETQRRRAMDYAKYMNLLEEAAEVAYQQIQLVNILKS